MMWSLLLALVCLGLLARCAEECAGAPASAPAPDDPPVTGRDWADRP